MTQETFLRNSKHIQDLLKRPMEEATPFRVDHVFGLVRYSIGSWLRTASVMSSGYFSREEVVEEPEEPIIEPLDSERDDENVTPTEEELAAGDEEAAEDSEAEPLAEVIEEAEPAPVFEGLQAADWVPVTTIIDEYFSFINRLVLFAPEMHKPMWREFNQEVESIFSRASLTPTGLAARFKMVEDLYLSYTKA